MAELQPRTDIYLVPDLSAALEVARELEADAVGLDAEGVLGNYVGNNPYQGIFEDFMRGQGAVNMSLANAAIENQPEVAFGIVTNNMNMPIDGEDGLVTRAADRLEIPFVHKGMEVGGVALKGKPSGELSERFCEIADVRPERAVLIDDQGVKNAGDAVRAGLKAIIVPDPIGLPGKLMGGVKEHKGVRFGRLFEPLIYSSLERQGWLARIAYRNVAGIDPALIGELYDRRDR